MGDAGAGVHRSLPLLFPSCFAFFSPIFTPVLPLHPTPPCFLRRYITAIQLCCQHLLRYLAVAVVINKRRRNVMKDLIRVIQQVGAAGVCVC